MTRKNESVTPSNHVYPTRNRKPWSLVAVNAAKPVTRGLFGLTLGWWAVLGAIAFASAAFRLVDTYGWAALWPASGIMGGWGCICRWAHEHGEAHD